MPIISVDVFDTLLLRDYGCERRRFGVIAARGSERLKDAGIVVDARLLLRTRADAQRLSYRALEAERPEGDVPLDRILALQTAILGIDPSFAAVLARVEIEVERRSLRANAPLLDVLAAHCAAGGRAIAISDTYLSAAQLGELFEHVVGGQPVDAVYTSADLGLTKRSGGLFAAVLAREGATPAGVRHLGDDDVADFVMAAQAGLAASRLQRPRLTRLARRIDAAAFRLAQGATS